VAALAGGLLLAGGCASSPPPAVETADAATAATAVPLPPLPLDDDEAAGGASAEGPGAERADAQGETPGEAARTVAAPSARAAEARPPASEPVRRQMIVIDEGSSEVRPEPGELARTTRRDAAASGGGAPRVTNENLADYARRGRVTVSGPAAAADAEAAADDGGDGTEATAPAAAGEPVRDEASWRAEARRIREEWRHTVDEIVELEETAADLRWRFYAEDDPWVRDGQVKPEWDRALDRLSEARHRLVDYPRRLEELIEEGRRQGALPGWLREGVELEPRPEELPAAEPDPAEPVEPRQVDEDPRGQRP
jgi:hypothetical protein